MSETRFDGRGTARAARGDGVGGRAPRRTRGTRRLPTALGACALLALGACSEGGGGADGTGAEPRGQGGSTARMTVAGDYLYAITEPDTVQLFDISIPESPNPWVRVRVDWDIETLFPYGDYLLVGAADGLHILDNTDPAAPRYIADLRHARARDPVVAADGYAYVTLRSVPGATGVTDQLDVVDIRDIEIPRLVRTLPMQGPGGLAVDAARGDASARLYVCDGIAGIKIFDLADPADPRPVESIRDVDCLDVIVSGDILYAITEDRLLQYDIEALPPVPLSDTSAEELSGEPS